MTLEDMEHRIKEVKSLNNDLERLEHLSKITHLTGDVGFITNENIQRYISSRIVNNIIPLEIIGALALKQIPIVKDQIAKLLTPGE